jgi:AcrR family transcriptional regulator
MSRPPTDHDERRVVIALAAAHVIASHGLDRLTMRDLAAELGVTTGVLTHYFPSKAALVAHTKELVFDLRFERARQAANGTPGLDRLHAVIAELLPLDDERVIEWRTLVAFQGSAVGSAAMRRAHDARMRRWFELFERLVSDAGLAETDADAHQLAMALVLFVEGVAIHFAMQEPPANAEWQQQFVRVQVDRFVQQQALT